MIKKYLLMIPLFACSLLATAQSVGTLQFNLEDCIAYALENNNSVKNAKIDAEIARRKVWETIGIGLPQVNANAQFQYFLDIPTQLIPDFISPAVYGVLVNEGVQDGNGNTIQFPTGGQTFLPARFGTDYNFSAGLEASQLLFDGSFLVGLQATRVYSQLSVKQKEMTEVDVIASVSKAYYNALIVKERLLLLEANIIRLEKTLADTKALNENGFVEKIDVQRLQVLFNNLQSEKENVEKLTAISLYQLKFQMGMDMDELLDLKGTIDGIPFNPEIEKIDSINYSELPTFKVLSTVNDLNRLDLKAKQASRLPSIVAFASVSRNSPGSSFNNYFNGNAVFFPSSVVGLKASMPIFGGLKKYQVERQAKLSVEKSTNDLERTKSALNFQARTAQVVYNNSVRSLENQKGNMELATEVLRVAKIKYQEGVGSNLEIVSAETSLKEAQTNYISSLYDALVAKIDLLKSKGELTK